ncbi:hypothetical protein EJ02DRAFT_157818 [Clathrospora elynae]|uniref:Uncharacterized protein n=1 Tax=Clathrospora elynae TaxID=706981 RepID=A0A6A5T133_9PLEO|nr:hypothetical protein EJ02DRAFT_157818 [Clathrospora elynae]
MLLRFKTVPSVLILSSERISPCAGTFQTSPPMPPSSASRLDVEAYQTHIRSRTMLNGDAAESLSLKQSHTSDRYNGGQKCLCLQPQLEIMIAPPGRS